ncbi:MAG: hypothetical protein OXT74_11550 [Candidatus Poribacteria bacterium]|nr:hypothetical protein [Candidatus Poribacteria bacterium]
MHGQSIATDPGRHLQLLPNTDWFTDGGVTPDGKWWIAPTLLFIEQVWHGCVGDDLRNQGFRLGHDGHRIGATQHIVIYFPHQRSISVWRPEI